VCDCLGTQCTATHSSRKLTLIGGGAAGGARTGHEYFGGSAFSVADLLVFDILDHNLRVDPKCLDAFPTLDAFHINIGHKHGVWQ
jgi:glutathione S-transferase